VTARDFDRRDLVALIERLSSENDHLRQENDRLRRDRETHRAEAERVRAQLDEASAQPFVLWLADGRTFEFANGMEAETHARRLAWAGMETRVTQGDRVIWDVPTSGGMVRRDGRRVSPRLRFRFEDG
jgi:hypothetical protein